MCYWKPTFVCLEEQQVLFTAELSLQLPDLFKCMLGLQTEVLVRLRQATVTNLAISPTPIAGFEDG